jgi:UrcA family protein
MKVFFLTAAAAFAVAGSASATSLAHHGLVTTKVAVPAADLDLSRPSDAATMLSRLERAAQEACGASQFSVREYQAAVRRSGCYREALDQAVNGLNEPAVSVLYREHAPVADLR